jgi:hypothetical protein
MKTSKHASYRKRGGTRKRKAGSLEAPLLPFGLLALNQMKRGTIRNLYKKRKGGRPKKRSHKRTRRHRKHKNH